MADSVVIPLNYGLATFKWTFIPAGKVFTVTMGYRDTDTLNDPNGAATALRAAMVQAGGPAAAGQMTTNWRFEGVSVLQRLSGGLLQQGNALTPVTGTSGSSADINPVYTTFVVSKITAYAGRAYRGRMYSPMTLLLESTVDFNGTINPVSLGLQQGYWNTFMGWIGLANYPLYLLHTTDQAGVTPLPTPILSLLVRPVVGIQRRRRARGA